MSKARNGMLGDGMACGAWVACAFLCGVVGRAATPVLAQEQGQADREIVVRDGVGYGDIVLGGSVESVYAKYGQPAVVPPNADSFYLDYRGQHGVALMIGQRKIWRIELHPGFPRRLESGVRCGDLMRDVFDKHGEPVRNEAIQAIGDVRWADKVLYEFPQPGTGNITYEKQSTTFFFRLGQVGCIYIRRPPGMPPKPVGPEIVVREGVGYDEIMLGATVDVVYARYGVPATAPPQTGAFSLDYKLPHDVSLRVADRRICAIELRSGFPGKTESGVRCGDSMKGVFEKYGEPIRTQPVNDFGIADRVLYEDPKSVPQSITYTKMGVTFFFKQGKVSSIFIRPASPPRTPPGLAQGSAVSPEQERAFRESDARLLTAAGISLDAYSLQVSQRPQGMVREYVLKAVSEQELKSREQKAASSIDSLHKRMPSLRDIVAELGHPPRILIGAIGASSVLSVMYGELQFFFGLEVERLREIRLRASGMPYRYRQKLSVGSSLEDVFSVFGQPAETVTGNEFVVRDRVLSVVKRGNSTMHYIGYGSEGVRFFFRDGKVVEMYLFRAEKPGEKPRGGA